MDDEILEALKNLGSAMDRLEEQQAHREIRLTTAIRSVADGMRDICDLLSRKLDDHHMVLQHEERIKALEARADGRNSPDHEPRF